MENPVAYLLVPIVALLMGFGGAAYFLLKKRK
jgi:hypothetical protein